MIAFRTDANAQIGTGHIMRCIAIAKELVKKGRDVLFITADGYPSMFLEQEGFKCFVLNTRFDDMEQEIKTLLHAIEEYKVDCMLVDSYYVTASYFEKLKAFVCIAYIDDFAQEAYPVDIIINYNIFSDAAVYKRLYGGCKSKILTGTEYTPLREEFRRIVIPPLREQITDMLITTGGTDPFGISALLAERILGDDFFKDMTLHLIVGKYYTNKTKLTEMSKRHTKLIVCENVKSMPELMQNCDIAVSASGMTLYELCACGIPSVIFGFADNQTLIRECFGKRDIMVDCGDIRNQNDKCINNMIGTVKMLAPSEKRNELRRKALSITDGLGAVRLADHLSECVKRNRF